ncbi:MAG: hypothetical protein JJU29_17510 [Verrucomicrobia bacterium]|nr:hypothetical protein [Verrucomicrobiota bacterium]
MTNPPTPLPKKTKGRKRILLLLLLAGVGIVLQNFPGQYTFKEVSEEYERDTIGGIGISGIASAELRAVLYFEEATLQRVSRNAQLEVPAGSTLNLRARTVPRFDEDTNEVIVVPEDVEILSDKPLTFIYRNVPVAHSRELRSVEGDPQYRIRAHGRYRILSALPRLHRYRRNREGPRREWEAPTRAEITFHAELKPNHTFAFDEKLVFTTAGESQRLVMDRLVYENGNWTQGDIDLNLAFQAPLQFGRVAIDNPRDARINVNGKLSRRDSESLLTGNGNLTMLSGFLRDTRNEFTAGVNNLSANPAGTLVLGKDLRLDHEDVRATLTGLFRDVKYKTHRDEITLPLLDLTNPAIRLSMTNGNDQVRLQMPAPLDVRGLNWSRNRPRESLRISDARLRINPFAFELNLGSPPSGVGENLTGLLEAWSVRLSRGEDQHVALENGVRLTLRAGRLIFADGEILVTKGQATGSAGTLRGGRGDFKAGIQGTGVSVRADRGSANAFTFEGELIPGEGAQINMTGPGALPDISLFADAQPVSFSGDQDHFRIGLPRLEISMTREDVMAMLNTALAEQRERIRQETADEISVGVDIRRIRAVTFAENQVSVTGEGRVYTLRDIISTSFSATMSVEFELPTNTNLDQAEMGLKATLTGLSLSNVNPRIEQLILNRIRSPLLELKRPLKEMIQDIPDGIRIDHSRLYATDEHLVLELSGSAVLD